MRPDWPLADIALAALAAEAAVLIARPHAALGRLRAAFALAPGACLLLALRSAAHAGGGPEAALWLTLSLPAHLTDMWLRAGGRGTPALVRARPQDGLAEATISSPPAGRR